MTPDNKVARLAGAMYLLLALTAPFSLMYVPNTLIVRGNATATAANIRHSEMLFRAGIAGELIGTVFFLFIVITLYRLLSDVDRTQAVMMVILAALSIPISFANVVNDIAALLLARGGEFLSVIDQPQREAFAMLFLRLHFQGIVVNEIFWGLWLIPFGVLVIDSRFLPKILGVLLLINGAAYVVVSMTWLLTPDFGRLVDRWATLPETGELWIMLWLLIKGVTPQRTGTAKPAIV